MKILHVVALIASLAFVGQAQSNSPNPQPERRTMADATYAIKGPVKFFRTEIATFVLQDGQYVEGPRVLRDEAWFNSDGNRTDYHIYANGVLVRRIVMKFDGRKMLEAINYDGNGNAWLRRVNIFDEKGQVKEMKTYNGDGSIHSTGSWQLNSHGQVVKYAELNAKGVLVEEIINKYEGRDLYTKERRLYDSNGSLKEETIFVAPNKQTETKFNADGSVASKSVRVGQEMARYGPDGSLQKATVIDSRDRLLDEMSFRKDAATTRQTQLPDEVDQHGNWTKQTRWFADPNGTRPLTITYRALTYYDN